MALAAPGAGWRGHLLAVASGALLTLSFAPFALWPLGLLAAALFNALLQRLSPTQAAWRGFAFGAGLFGSGASWVYVSIHIYGAAPVPLAVLLTAVFCLGLASLFALFSYGYARWLRPAAGGRIWGFAAAWVLLDWVRSWLLSGFPWLYTGYAYLHTPLAGWAPVGGVWLVSFAALASAGWLAQLAAERKPRWLSAGLVVGFCLGGWALATVQWTQPEGPPRRVALVQANVPQSVKWNPGQFWPTLALYQRMSEPLWSGHDLVVWPEAAIPGYFQSAQGFVTRLRAKANGADLITGSPWREPGGSTEAGAHSPENRVYNSLVAVTGQLDVYHKQHLVPFGEFVPLEQWLRGLIAFFDLPMSSFSAGSADQSPLEAGGMTLAPAICYEVVYPEQLRQFLPDAEILITVSNDAWFGRSIGPHQHLQMAQMRALEYGREMIRSTGNGVTALIDHRGRIRQQLPQFERAVLSGEVQPYRGTTPFAALGGLPWIGLFSLIPAGMLIKRRRP